MKNKKGTIFAKAAALVAAVIMSVTAFAACNSGEQLAYGKELLTLNTQLDTLTQLNMGAIDAAVIDSVMAGYYSNNGEYAGKVTIMDAVLQREQYGIAARKDDKAFMSKINEALIALYGNGGMQEVADQFGLTADIALESSTKNPLADATDSSWDDIVASGKIIIGYTIFAPIAFDEGDGLTGYDIELAKKTIEYLNEKYSVNLTPEFQIIDWDSKEALLTNGTIDLIWNGLTIDDERLANMCISVPYLNNDQVAVVRTEDKDKYVTPDDLKDAVIGVEKGSAGESVVRGE
ncbi:MAG TPA: transporter substrate-binding domain-containing protein [Firmicutes bacterium]|nr:transporter substrate-binding domain-containing protein [Bacillota bacterium]